MPATPAAHLECDAAHLAKGVHPAHLRHHAVVTRSIAALQADAFFCWKATGKAAGCRLSCAVVGRSRRHRAACTRMPDHNTSHSTQHPATTLSPRSLCQAVHEQGQHGVHAHARLQLRQRAQQGLQCAQVELVCGAGEARGRIAVSYQLSMARVAPSVPSMPRWNSSMEEGRGGGVSVIPSSTQQRVTKKWAPVIN